MSILAQKLQRGLFAQERQEKASVIAAKVAEAFVPSVAAPSLREKAALLRMQALADTDHHAYKELNRICKLPLIPRLEPEEVEEISRRWILAEPFSQGKRLFREQAEAILQWEVWDANFNPIGVGWGKGLISLMLAEHSFRTGTKKIAYLCPAQTYSGFVQHYLPWARRMIPISYPVTELGSLSSKTRQSRAKSERRGLYLLPYSCLSTKDAEDILKWVSPEILILDEAHYLKNARAARTRRILDYIDKSSARVAALSGTITSKGIRDYHHILRACLLDSSPLPIPPIMAGEWGQVIDSGSTPTDGMVEPLRPLVDWARRNFRDEEIPVGVAGFRKAYRLRLTSAPGVTASGDSEVSCSLVLCNQSVPEPEKREGWDALKKHLEVLEKQWLTPDGDEIDHAIHAYKWAYELTAGFYNSLYWDTPEHLAAVKMISLDEAKSRLERAKEHHAVGQVYAKELRDFLSHHARLHLDTPMLVGASMQRHGDKEVGAYLYGIWREMKNMEFDEMPERLSRAVRVCDFKVNHALCWAQSLEADEGGILWVYHQELGIWVTELLLAALGPSRVVHCPAGEQYDTAIQDPANRGKIAVASISAHGTGKNLQHYSRQFFLQWPRPADRAEQTLGRTHRNGQEADELIVWRCDTSEFDQMVFAACVNDALYIHQTTGARQKLIYATYDEPMPKMFSPEALRERGFQNRILDSTLKRILEERFTG